MFDRYVQGVEDLKLSVKLQARGGIHKPSLNNRMTIIKAGVP
jgi:hypothetical protein